MGENLSWREAIISVLRGAPNPLHPVEIADVIYERQLRQDFGATPAATVGSVIYTSIKNDGPMSPFMRVGKALFMLRSSQNEKAALEQDQLIETESSETASGILGVINAFGMFWDRNRVDWTAQPRILGIQEKGTIEVNFCRQRGVYLLHDVQGVVYVGRTTDQDLGQRLFQHTYDRLNGRWDRFSWFGIYPAQENGELGIGADFSQVDINIVIATMEALLIESLEPRQNRKRGDDFKAVEFLQREDPNLKKKRELEVLKKLEAGASK